MENFIELKPGVLLQGISEKQYNKLRDITESNTKAVKVVVDLANGKIGRIEVFFKKTTELKKDQLENFVLTRLMWVTLENNRILRTMYMNYITGKYETATDHVDNKIGSISSIKTGMTKLLPSYAYIVATIKEQNELPNALS